MKNNKKISKSSVILVISIILFLLITISEIVYIQTTKIELTQFSPTTDRQMMGYSIKTASGKLIIIDGGNIADANQLLNYIKQNGSEVEAWFLTHIHTDHVGAFTQIVNNSEITIKNIYASMEDKKWYTNNEPSRQEDIDSFFKAIDNENIKNKIKEQEAGNIITVDNVQAKILAAKNSEITNNAINNSSMVIKFSINNKSILFLGDTGTEKSDKLLQTCSKEELKSTIVQVAHHGQNGATEQLYKTIQPQICLWPTTTWLWNNDSGAGEDSGTWKTKETRKWIEDLKVTKNYLAQDGIQTLTIY